MDLTRIGNLIAGRGERPFALIEDWRTAVCPGKRLANGHLSLQKTGERPFAPTEEWRTSVRPYVPEPPILREASYTPFYFSNRVLG